MKVVRNLDGPIGGSARGRVMRGLGATGFGLAVTFVIQVASVPAFLHGFGVRLYGEWLVMSAVPAYLSLSDLGFVGVVGNEMTMRVAVHDLDGAKAAFQTVWGMMTALSATVGGVVVAAVWLFPTERLLQVERIPHRDVALTLTFLALTVLVMLQALMLEAGFRCEGLFPRGNAGISVVRFIGFVAAASGALAGTGVVGVAAAQLGATTIGFVGLRILMRRDVPWLHYGVSSFSRPLLRKLASPALAYLGLPIGNALALQGMVVVVSAELGAAAVVVLSVVRTVATGIRQCVNVINHAVWPELSRAIAADEMTLARRLHAGSLRAAIAVAGGVAVVLAVAGRPLIHLWADRAVLPSSVFLQLMLLTTLLDVAWLSSLIVLASVNRHQRASLLYLGSNAVAIALAAVFVPVIGLPAVPIALMTSDVVLTGYVIRESTRLLGQSRGEFARQLVGLGTRLQPRRGVVL
jgi:O-antigen/teichoic acid export membrane protein